MSLIIICMLLTSGMLPKIFRLPASRIRMFFKFHSGHQRPRKQKLKSLFIFSMFRGARKIGKSVLVSSPYMSVRMEQLGPYWTDVREVRSTSAFRKICRENSSFIKIGEK